MKAGAHEVLSEILGNGVDVHRCAAARALGKIASPGANEILVKSLLDEDPDVRVDAASSLGSLNDPSCAEALMENLIGDPESDVKKTAISALVAFRYEPVLPLLRKLVTTRTEEIFWDEDEYYTDGWDSWLDLQLLAIKGVATFGAQEAVPDILAAMADELGQDVSEAGVTALAALGPAGAEALETLYDSGVVRLRRRIADAVVLQKSPLTHELIERMLADESAKVRQITALGLDSADPRLEILFADPDSSVRASVVRHAGSHFPTLVGELIKDSEADVRAEVFKEIAKHPGLFEGEDISTSVREAIAGEPEAAKQAALAWIAIKGPSGIKGLTHVMTNKKVPLEFRVGVIEAMKKAGSSSVPHLLKAAGDDERQLRLASLTALVDFAANDPIWPNPAGEGLLAALNGELVLPPEEPEESEEEVAAEPLPDVDALAADEEQEVDETMPLVPEGHGTSTLDAILSGGAPDPEQAEEPEPVELSEKELRFLELSKQRAMSKRKMSLESDVAPHLDVRRFAASLLGGVPNLEVTENLIAVLDDDDLEVRNAALSSLVQHGEKKAALPASALEALSENLSSETSESRVLSVRALGWLEGEGIDEKLHELLSDPDDFVRVEAVRSLDIRGVADEQVERCLKDGYLGVGIAAATSLARNRGEEAVDALVAFAFDNDGTYRHDIGRMLGEYASDAGARRLIEILGDESYKRNWLVAIDALAEIFSQQDQSEELKVA